MAAYKEHEFLSSILLRLCLREDGSHLAEGLVIAQGDGRLTVRLEKGDELSPGTLLVLRQPRYKGRMDVDATVVAVNPGGTVELAISTAPALVQTRSHPRIDTRIPCTYRVLGPLTEGEAEKAYANEMLRCRRDRNYFFGYDDVGTTVIGWRGQKVIGEVAINLSCSGACLHTVEQVPAQSSIMLYLFIYEAPYVIAALAQVLDSKPVVEGDGKGRFRTRLRFVFISDRDQNFIDDYVSRYEARFRLSQ